MFKELLGMYHKAGSRRKYEGNMNLLVMSIAVIMSIYQIWEVTLGAFTPIRHMSIHLTFILVLTFLIYSFTKGRGTKMPGVVDIICIVAVLFAGIYFNLNMERIVTRNPMVDPLSTLDMLAGSIFVVASFEAARRTLGGPITYVAAAFIMYMAFGHLVPGGLWHRQMSFMDQIDQMSFTFNGIWGSPMAVASTFVFLFVLFGSFLSKSGCGDFFFDIANAVAGGTTGGGAKVAVVSSGLFGMISGSPTANAVTTGAFTIPMNKKLGYTPVFAAAIEAVAATGGSIMPPIMGSSAFLMAEVAGIPYVKICIAAAIPAVLYYVSLLAMVHFEALKSDLKPMDRDMIPPVWKVLKNGWQYSIPIVVLVWSLLSGHSPSMTAIYGIVTVIIISWFKKSSRMYLKDIAEALGDGAKSSIQVTTACAAAGMVVAGIMSTGLGGKITSVILGLTQGMLLPTLIMVAIICLILGMGMPVAAAYVLTAMLAVPAMLQLGVSLMAAHLFVVYFSIISAITPPVAVAAYACAGIADCDPSVTGWQASKLGLAAFLVPFMFVYNETLLFEGTFFDIGLSIILGSLGVIALAAGVQGHAFNKLNLIQRLAAFAGGLLLIDSGYITDIAGIAMIAGVLITSGGFKQKKNISNMAA
ncbi:MAG: hypothetical protein AGIKBDMD_00511 [Synergistaceae bacterium]|nr:MAG: C4-dicarboxylate ABC transporter [Synergistetes bacterium HGW-Synergistetes-1]